MIDAAPGYETDDAYRLLEMRSAWGGTTLPPINWSDESTAAKFQADPVSSLQVSAFLACVRVLSESVAQLPCHLYRLNPDGTADKAVDHPLYTLLHDRPNPWQSSYEFRETLVAHTATWGNGFARKVFDGAGRVVELWPMHPSQVSVSRLANNALVYTFNEIGLPPRQFTDDQVCHIRWLSDNGYLGMVPLSLQSGIIGLVRSMDRYSQKFWQNDARPGVVMESNQPIPPEAADKLRQSWERMHRGSENAGRTAILPNGITIKELSGASNESAQLIEMRVFLVQEIARAMRVPCSMIGENSRSTFSNAEQEQLSFLQNTLVAWCRRVESALERSLLSGMPGYSIRLDVRGMLRGDSAARSAYYGALSALGALSPNDIRRLEDMPPIASAGADEYYLPANNLSPLSRVAEPEDQADPATSTAVLAILQTVAAGTITAASAEALILAAFPELDPVLVKAMVEGAEPPAEEATETPAEESVEAVAEAAVEVEAANEPEAMGETNGN
jgi:HK97 family phage portal protein